MASFIWPPKSSGSGGGIASINGDTTSAQIITGGSGVSVSTSSGTTTVANTGVTSILAGTGISVNPSTGAVTITNQNPPPSNNTIVSNVTLTYNSFNFINTTAARTLTFPAPVSGNIIWTKDISFQAATHNVTFARHSSENIEGVAANYVAAANGFAIQWISDGTNWYIGN